nr:hypothetical protein [Tanacetum cinerariifolium]
MANEEENHALVADEEAPTEFALMAKTSAKCEVFDNSLCSKTCKKNTDSLNCKITELTNKLSDSENMLYHYKLGLPEFANDTVTNYSRPSPAIESTSEDLQNRNPSVTETGASRSNIVSKPFIKFVKATDSPTENKADKVETVRKTTVKYAELYRKTSKKSNVRVRSQFRGPRVPTVNRKVPTVNRKFPTVNRKFPTGNSKFSTADMGNKGKAVKASAYWIWKPSQNLSNKGNSQNHIKDKGYWDSGCSWHMTGNISYLSDYEPLMEDMCLLVKEDARLLAKEQSKPNSVLFTDSECIMFGRDFKLIDDTNVLLRTPRQHNMYFIDLNNIVPHKDLTCLVAKASANECMLWHRRLGHLNFKTMNKLVRHNLVRGLPTKFFENDHNCTACLKGKQHKASCKTKLVNSVTKPLHTLHMDLFGPTSDEASGILRNFMTEIENLKELRVKIIRCDNEGEFRNKEMNDFCLRKGIKREFSNARTTQQNGVAKRRNRTLKEAARTMLADAKLPVTFWAEAVNTACTKEAVGQDVKKDVPSLRYIVLLNWFHKTHFETSISNAQNACNADAPESSGNFNPTATSINPSADQIETLTVKTPIPTVSSPVLTACLNDSPEPSSDTRLISKRVTSQDDTPSLDNILTLTNRFKDILGVTTNTDDTNGVEADLGNIETTITASPTPTLRIHKDHPKSQIISPMDTSIQTRNKSKEMEEQSFIATIHQKTNPALLQFYLFSCFLSQDLEFPAKVYKVEKAMYGLHQAPRTWHQVAPKECHLHAVKRIFRYLKGHPKLGLWYPKESPFDLVAYSDSDYGGTTQDHKSTTRGCQFLGKRLISWQCKKLTIMATSTTEAEYVAAASSCGQVLWIQNVTDHVTSKYYTYCGENDKIERLIIDGKVVLVDDEGKPLDKVDSFGDHDSEDEFASVDNENIKFFCFKEGWLWYL